MTPLDMPRVYEECRISTRQILREAPPMKIAPLDSRVIESAANLFELVKLMPLEEKVACINKLRELLHEVSPFKQEPVDLVRWVLADGVTANDYNPNSVAPPEMKLLEQSIESDGYTQPIVTWVDGEQREVIDGFHRNRVGKESPVIRARVLGYLPVVTVNNDRQDKGDRIAATIRHNRARGKHKVEAMSDIVIELKRRNWSDEKIAKNLGMDPDEILRLTQISGLAEMFADQEFSSSWDLEDATEADIVSLDDE
jgi:ParB-like chromosome segregation protein Spo0J